MRTEFRASLLLALFVISVALKAEAKDSSEKSPKISKDDLHSFSILRIDDIKEEPTIDSVEEHKEADEGEAEAEESVHQDMHLILLQQQQILQQQQLQQRIILQLQQNQLQLQKRLEAQQMQQQSSEQQNQPSSYPIEEHTEYPKPVDIKTIDLNQLLAQKYGSRPMEQPDQHQRPHHHHHHHQGDHHHHYDRDNEENDYDDNHHHHHRPRPGPRPRPPTHHYRPPSGYGYYSPYAAPASSYYYQLFHYPSYNYPANHNPYGGCDYRYRPDGGSGSYAAFTALAAAPVPASLPYVRSSSSIGKTSAEVPVGVIPFTTAALRDGAQLRSAEGGNVQAATKKA